ncbi:putative anthranilate phosphoribosyltransferase [Actinacidiphila reveromycinica]|uniref:Anthranilate phosphoribosyltransferase n=1 Tax=Actinacidiphila reveromycinica TaxID=659352 RepID=A0A7U3UQB7_9ACTN|nr:anthranilate phosphoribosyltransferase [Streptomyces sp. SN-593]BBA96827.1 putative anthranilate phosphoribosyltransferase [Streptomyces sp. SN-593]
MSVVHPAGGEPGAARAWPDVLGALIRRDDLSSEETAWAMDSIMSGEATDAQIAGFAVALRSKGETVAEIAGLVEAMYAHATTIEVPGPAVDVVGTGGDRSNSVNISTMSAIVVAGTGTRVVKHGSRSASSKSGASDVLAALGVDLDLPPQRVAQVALEVGITFCFAVRFHPALRHVATARAELGVATPFNFLGPLTNPARVRAQATGVADLRMAPILAGVLAERGSSALVFRGDDGLDELTTTATSQVWVVRDGKVEHTGFDPRDVGLELVPVEALRGGEAAYNAEVARRLLAGERGPVRDAVLLNSAAALTALAPADGRTLEERIAEGLVRAAESIDSGAAAAVLERWVAATRG